MPTKYQQFSAENKPKVLLRPSIHGLVTYIQVNVYIGNTLSWLSFQNCHMLKIK